MRRENLWIYKLIKVVFICLASTVSATPKVLVLLPLTGGAPEMGGAGLRGVKQAEEELRAEGLEFELKIEDVQFSSKQAISVVTREQFDGIISASSQVSIAIKPLVKVPQIAIFTQSDAYSSPDDLSYRISGLISDEWRSIENYFKKTDDLCLLSVDAEYGEGVVKVANTFSVRFFMDSPSLREETDLCLKRNPRAILVAGLPRHFDAVATRLKERNYQGVLFGFRPTEAKKVDGLKIIASDCPDDCYFSESYEATKIMIKGLLSNKPFKEWMKQPFKTRLGVLNFNSYGDTNQNFNIRELY